MAGCRSWDLMTFQRLGATNPDLRTAQGLKPRWRSILSLFAIGQLEAAIGWTDLSEIPSPDAPRVTFEFCLQLSIEIFLAGSV